MQVVASQGQCRQPLPLIWTVCPQLWQRDQCSAGTGDLVLTQGACLSANTLAPSYREVDGVSHSAI